MRESSYRIDWIPGSEGSDAVSLVAVGDLLTREIQPTAALAHDARRIHRRPASLIAARGNQARRLAFEVIREHATREAQWQALADAAVLDEWGTMGLLSVRGTSGAATVRAACIESSRHEIMAALRTRHAFTFRVAQGLGPDGEPISIIGGWVNPPSEDYPNGSVTIIVDNSGGDVPDFDGDYFQWSGGGGVPGGIYTGTTTGGSSGGNSEITLALQDEPEEPSEDGGEVIGGSAAGNVDMEYAAELRVFGCDDGASYQYSITSGGGLQSLTPDPGGQATISLGTLASRITYDGWYGIAGVPPGGPDPNPLPLTGEDQPGGYGGNGVTETGPGGWTVKLFRNGVEIDSHEITPAWTARKTHGAGGASHTLSSSFSLTFTVNGPGSISPDYQLPIGAPVRITDGSLQPLAAES